MSDLADVAKMGVQFFNFQGNIMKKYQDRRSLKLFSSKALLPISLNVSSNENCGDWIKEIFCESADASQVLMIFSPTDQGPKKKMLLMNIESMLSDAKIDSADSDMDENTKLDMFHYDASGDDILVYTEKPKVFVSQLANANIISLISLSKLNHYIDNVVCAQLTRNDDKESTQLLHPEI